MILSKKKHLRIVSFTLLLLCVLTPFNKGLTQDRRPSYPLVTGDGFRDFSDFIYDETDRSFDPTKVSRGDVIFVKTDFIREFFTQIHPKIPNPYIIISHNSAYPNPGSCKEFLDDPKILAWFAQNTEGCIHKKLIPIPL